MAPNWLRRNAFDQPLGGAVVHIADIQLAFGNAVWPSYILQAKAVNI